MPSFAHTAYVSTTGNDSTAELDSQTLKFATAQAAYNAVYSAWSSDQSNYYLLQFDAGSYTEYGNINAYADWPDHIWIQGSGADVTSIGNIVGFTPAPVLYYGDHGGNLAINSDASISIQNITSGDGGYATDDGDSTGNITGGDAGSVTLNSVVVVGYVNSGNGGSTDPSITEGTIGGSGGTITITNSSVGANVTAGNGSSGGGASATVYSGNGGSIYGNGQISSTSYENSSFYAGSSANAISTIGIDGVAGYGGVIELTNINFSQAFAGGRGQQGYFTDSYTPAAYVGIEGCQFYAIYAANGQPYNYNGEQGGSGGYVYVYNSTGHIAVAGNGVAGWYLSGTGGNAVVTGSTIDIVVAGNGGGDYYDIFYTSSGNNGGNISFSNSTCNDWLYAGHGGNSVNYYNDSSLAGNGGNIVVVSSTIPDGIHGGIAGYINSSNYDGYESPYSGNFGTIIVDESDPAFSYPFTTPVEYIDELGSAAWDLFAQWKDSNGNFSSRLPNSSDDLNIYSTIFYGRNANAGPFSANTISLHNASVISVGVECNSATFRDSSVAAVGNFYLNNAQTRVYNGGFFGATEVNFYDNSGCVITNGAGGGSNGSPNFYQFGLTANIHSTNSITNILNFLNNFIGNWGGNVSSPLFNTYNYMFPSSSSGNKIISRLLCLPWFINI